MNTNNAKLVSLLNERDAIETQYKGVMRKPIAIIRRLSDITSGINREADRLAGRPAQTWSEA